MSGIGIVHLGLGNFFRAHGAVYIQEALSRFGGDWAIMGVSLRSAGVRDRLAPRDFAYTSVTTSSGGLAPQDISAIRGCLVAPEDPAAVLNVLAHPDTRIVSLTVTEKGYCRGPNGIDLEHPDVAHDIAHPLPRSAPGLLVRALAKRRQAGVAPFTVLSLDNLAQNGTLTRQIVLSLAKKIDPSLSDWIAQEGRFPSTMVDRIVPATTPDMIDRLRETCGIDDQAAVFHEPFRQWVIEDDFVGGARPDLAAVGAQMVADVTPFEHMKLRMLNGSHSALAYLGSLAGHATVAEAMGNPNIAAFVQDLWHAEVIPSLTPPPGEDLSTYASALEDRFRNPEIHHRLEQIAMDGSQKLPQRILAPLFENKAAGRPHIKLITVLAGWMAFVRHRAKDGHIDDPLAPEVIEIAHNAKGDGAFVEGLCSLGQIFGGYPMDEILDTLTARVSHPLKEL